MHPTNNMFIMGQGGLSLDVPSDYDGMDTLIISSPWTQTLPCGSSTSSSFRFVAPKDQKLATQFAQYAQQIFTLAGQSSFAAKVSALPAPILLCLCSVLTRTPHMYCIR
jgi:hypothetical protein